MPEWKDNFQFGKHQRGSMRGVSLHCLGATQVWLLPRFTQM